MKETDIREAWIEHAIADDEYESHDVRYFANDICNFFLALRAKELGVLRERIWFMKREFTETDPDNIQDKKTYGGNLVIEDVLRIVDDLIEKPTNK
jgi:hypothetical protein